MKKLLVLTCATLVTGSVFASGYGAAGCGLGSIVLGNQPGIMQVFAATTNGTSGSQTFGITSGTSNCGKGIKSVLVYVEANKVALSNDIARGQGETLKGLADVLGIKDATTIGPVLQKEYKAIFATQDAKQINDKIVTALKTAHIL